MTFHDPDLGEDPVDPAYTDPAYATRIRIPLWVALLPGGLLIMWAWAGLVILGRRARAFT